MSGLVVAARYLTVVPLPGPAPAALDGLGRAAPWFPIVGLALGVALAVVDAITLRLFPPLLAALLTITVWKVLTGGLHLDGFADCLDGLVGRDPEHRLAIMRDSRIGAFGAMGLILFLMLEIAALADVPATARRGALIAAPAIARATPPLIARLFRPARASGAGVLFSAGVSRWAAPLAVAIAIACAQVALRRLGIVAVAAALLAALGVARLFAVRLGGVTGDVHGAAIEAAELTTLLVVSAWTHAGL